MFRKKNDKIDYGNLNDVLKITKSILKIVLVTIIIIAIYVILMVLKETKIINIFLTILSVLSPFFLGLAIAWLLNPFVNLLERKGIRRAIGITFSYTLLLLILVSIDFS